MKTPNALETLSPAAILLLRYNLNISRLSKLIKLITMDLVLQKILKVEQLTFGSSTDTYISFDQSSRRAIIKPYYAKYFTEIFDQDVTIKLTIKDYASSIRLHRIVSMVNQIVVNELKDYFLPQSFFSKLFKRKLKLTENAKQTLEEIDSFLKTQDALIASDQLSIQELELLHQTIGSNILFLKSLNKTYFKKQFEGIIQPDEQPKRQASEGNVPSPTPYNDSAWDWAPMVMMTEYGSSDDRWDDSFDTGSSWDSSFDSLDSSFSSDSSSHANCSSCSSSSNCSSCSSCSSCSGGSSCSSSSCGSD